MLAHDLRNPLSVILVSLRLLERSIGAEHGARRQLDALGRAADEMNAILQDLSDANRIEAGELLMTRMAPLEPSRSRRSDPNSFGLGRWPTGTTPHPRRSSPASR